VDSYTLADLERVTGAKRRSLQLWADAGVIKAVRGTHRAGTGTHRLFPFHEAVVACIVHAFALHQIAIGELLTISARIREALHPGSHKGGATTADDDLTDKEKRAAVIQAAIDGDTSWLLVYESWQKDVRRQEHNPPDWRTVCSVTAVKAGKAMRTPAHLGDPQGFAVVISLARYLHGLDDMLAGS
jgi:hypothetical protein